MRGRVVWTLLIASAAVVAGCGGSSRPSGAPAPTTAVPDRALLARVFEATNRPGTFRFSQSIQFEVTGGGEGMSMRGSGVTDIASNLSEWTITGSASSPHLSNGTPEFSAAPTAESFIWKGSRLYDRLVGPPDVTHDWCWTTPKTTAGPGVAPTATLATLAKSAGTVTEVGTAVVRGVSTTHYVVTGGGRTRPVDIWVDASDELRRIRWTLTRTISIQTTTSDLYDFGAPASIKIPDHAPACKA